MRFRLIKLQKFSEDSYAISSEQNLIFEHVIAHIALISPDQDNLSSELPLSKKEGGGMCKKQNKKSSEASQAAINSASAAYVEYIHEKKKE